MPPFEEGKLAARFHFLQHLSFFRDPISPIYSFLTSFYRAHKPDPQQVTKSYERVTKSYERVTKKYEQVTKVTKQLQKVITSYEN